MVTTKNWFGLFLMLALPVILMGGSQESTHQHHNQTDKRHEGVNERGDHAMGFDHLKTTHHFKLAENGGSIEVTANDAKDTESIEKIRMHLSHIAKLFKQGDFSKPMFIHDEVPPGVPVMKRLTADITYEFESIEGGGRVRITTANAEALDAIRQFLRYQINDHQTGDPQ